MKHQKREWCEVMVGREDGKSTGTSHYGKREKACNVSASAIWHRVWDDVPKDAGVCQVP